MDEEYCSIASSSKKRKQPDEDEELLRDGLLSEEPIENEYENLDEGEDDEIEDEETLIKNKDEYDKMLKNQEPATITRYDDIKITPFNIQEELEEGEIDEAGNFVLSKRSLKDEEENDNWAESVDWDAVVKKEMEQDKGTSQQDSRMVVESKSKPEHNFYDRISCYKQMLRIMRPDETIQRTIRRLGNDVPKRRPRNKSKQIQSIEVEGKAEEIQEAKRKLDLMIELAHQRLEDGDMDIYQKSYEQLEGAIN